MAKSVLRNISTNKRLFVAAIDLGTTYSGWAYSTLREPDKIHANQSWIAGSGSLASLKAPSCVLLTPNKEFECFGYDAETMFASLVEKEEHKKWYYFKRFKMTLYDDRKLTQATTIEDMTGKKMPALVIFAHSIKYLKDNFIQTIRKRLTNVLDTDVTYVLTVPAIWNDLAKTFMREAAEQAGIPNDQLIIALEPEAASIWCQRIHTEVHHDIDTADLDICSVGTRYMIVDLGGGTADITVHEKCQNNTLLEIHKPSGGAWGGTKVDQKFIQLLENILGPFVWKKFITEETEDLLDIYRDFEMKKRNIKADNTGFITIKTPSSLKDCFEQNGKRSIAELGIKFEKKVEWKKDKLRIDSALLLECFEEPLNQAILHINDILSEKSMSDVNKIMLVGGFAESPFVQETLKTSFIDKQILIPPECGLAVLKGAVLFGHNPFIITSRISRYTYGLEIAVPFDCTKHSTEKLVHTDVGPMCRDVFWKAVEIGQKIVNGHEVSRVGKAVDDNQQKIVLKIVKSKQQNPRYTTDEECEVIGKAVVLMDDALNADENAVDEIFIFGGPELILKTRHRKTGQIQKLRLSL